MSARGCRRARFEIMPFKLNKKISKIFNIKIWRKRVTAITANSNSCSSFCFYIYSKTKINKSATKSTVTKFKTTKFIFECATTKKNTIYFNFSEKRMRRANKKIIFIFPSSSSFCFCFFYFIYKIKKKKNKKGNLENEK